MATAAYDEIADRYEERFLGAQRLTPWHDPLGIDRAPRDLPGDGFADRGDPAAVVIRPGYLDGHWTRKSWTDQGIRDKVGATHWPLPELMHAFLDAGLTLERFTEGGTPVPIVLAARARNHRPSGGDRGERPVNRPEWIERAGRGPVPTPAPLAGLHEAPAAVCVD